MTTTAILLWSLTGALPVEAMTLDGDTVAGELVSLTRNETVIDVAGETRSLSLDDLHEVRLTENANVNVVRRRARPEVRLVDGTRTSIDQATSTATSTDADVRSAGGTGGAQASRARPPLGENRQSGRRRHGMPWSTGKRATISSSFVRETRSIKSGCVVTGVETDAVKFLLDGEPVPIPRARVFGIVFANQPAESSSAVGRIDLAGGDSFQVSSVEWDGQAFRAVLVAGATVRLEADDVVSLDFSLGKIRYLSDMDPSAVRYAELELSVAKEFPEIAADLLRYRRGQTREGRPLQVGGREYTRGLWLHSGTTITYRLSREFRRFRAIMDIDQDVVSERCDPVVDVVIRGDERELLRGNRPQAG